MCSERVSSSSSTSDTRRVNLVTNPMISHEREKDREVFTTSGTYPWSFVTQIFHNCQPYQRCELESRRWRTNTKQNVSSRYNSNTVTFVYRHCYYFFDPRILNTQMKGKRFIQRNQFWNLQKACNQKPLSHLYAKGHSGNLKMCPLWAVALYIPVKFICAIPQ
jgi:hypothetical protein